MKQYLDFAREIAIKAEEIMLKYYNIDNGSYYKFDDTIVTKADNEINEYLKIRNLKKAISSVKR
jgi:3'-phosphoadenosine 5'-phosphosulfate (PAPS) 3'-phosphatase